jgi:hypothetical protein
MSQIYLFQNGQQVGPYQVEALQGWIDAGQLQITDAAWFEGCANWVTLADVPGIILPQGGQGAFSGDVPPFEAYEGEDPYLFVSYSHQDAQLVFPEMIQLREAGYNIWYDEGVAASNEWPEEIANAVLGCSVFLCFISPRATESVNCRNEINLALNEKKPFLAIHLEETELPAGLRLRMGDLQAILKNKIPADRYFSKVAGTIDQLLGRKNKANLGALERASSLYVSRDGQTFGPYNLEQASQYLQSGQFLPSDLALVEGQTEWKLLPDALRALDEADKRHKLAAKADLPSNSVPAKKRVSQEKKTNPKAVKIQGLNRRTSTVKVKEKSLLTKLIATVMVFIVSMVVVGGSTLGAYLVAPSQVGPIVRKFGVPIDIWFPGWEVETVDIVEAPPGTIESIRLSKQQWHHLKSSGITILPLEGEDGLQVLSPIDPKLAINDDDLKVLHLIAQHLVVLDLTNSEVSDAGLENLQKFPNLKKLTLENSKKITAAGIQKIESVMSLEHLNLVGLALDDSVVNSIAKMESLLEVYLYRTGISEDAINALKASRPRMFVNAG